MPNLSKPDLTQFPPRSPRVQLGGYVHLPRLLDKARATVVGKHGEYHYDCPIDRLFFAFTGIKAKALMAVVKKGRTDSQMLAWVRKATKRNASEIASWSAWMRGNAPGAAAGHERLSGVIKTNCPARDDIYGFFDMLDMDDYASFGGKP